MRDGRKLMKENGIDSVEHFVCDEWQHRLCWSIVYGLQQNVFSWDVFIFVFSDSSKFAVLLSIQCQQLRFQGKSCLCHHIMSSVLSVILCNVFCLFDRKWVPCAWNYRFFVVVIFSWNYTSSLICLQLKKWCRCDSRSMSVIELSLLSKIREGLYLIERFKKRPTCCRILAATLCKPI